MKKHLNTLFVTTQGAYLAKDGECVAVNVEGERRLSIPVHTLDGVVCFGNVGVSPFLLGLCAQNDVAVSFLTEHGRFLAKAVGPVSGNILLRRAQFNFSQDPERTAGIARSVIIGKIVNSRTSLRRFMRDHGDGESRLAATTGKLQRLLPSLECEADIEVLRGLEGDASRAYFQVFDSMITSDDPAFAFTGRNRRPPLDPVNCLLSFLYTILAHDVRAACESVGLDSQVGFLHADRPGRPSLALDLMEELRPILADRLALSLINRGQVKSKGFKQTESGAVLMDDDTRKAVLIAYQKRKQDVVTHPFTKEKMPFGLIPFIQARLLARHLRGDLDAYPPYLWR